MNILNIIFLTMIFFILVLIFIGITLFIPRLYCFVWEHKEWKLWEEFIKRIDEFEFNSELYNSYQFIIPKTDIRAYIWGKGENEDDPLLNTSIGYCSIHNDSECLCCTFDRYHSKKMADLLMEKIKTEKENNYVK